jgi:transcriptional regulator with XRE-family HTH domain
MGRRIPSFEKIEKIAAALRIEPHILFQEERGEIPEKKPSASTRDLLAEMHPKIRRELCRRLLREIRKGVNSSFNPENY